MKEIRGEVEISAEAIKEAERIEKVIDYTNATERASKKNITEFLDIILVGGIKIGTSDIHIEAEEDRARLRIRLDGILNDILFFERKIYQKILSRIKLLAQLKINIDQRPQDGRFTIKLGGNLIEIRASTIPTEYGESIVFRILNPENLIAVEQLGLRADIAETLEKEISKPNGMIIVTGPTGSGKTTTLYAFLKKINNPDVKIITIEDPIEYHLIGINQTQVDPKQGYTFAAGLRSIVRQDPDVILVGEIRDLETAEIALQAALTGHLVFSTMHTNDAAGTIARFVSLGEKPNNIAPALNLAIAQRLMRRVCKKCFQLIDMPKEEEKEVRAVLEKLPREKKKIDLSKPLKMAEPKGCEYCNFSGYKGRVGIYEVLQNNDQIENTILSNPSINELRKKAIENGMITLREDGLIKIIQYITTLKELNRVTK